MRTRVALARTALICLLAGTRAIAQDATPATPADSPPPVTDAPASDAATPVPERAGKGFRLGQLQTDDLRVLYMAGPQDYLLPWASRNFLHSLALQQRIFGWKPWERPTVVLTDLSDYGNGAALVSPANIVAVEVSPTGHAFETMPSSERFHSLANHEIVHLATMDTWNATDARWRRFFGGKPRESDEQPETLLYNYLATPRRSTPRWYTEGSAVFMETWLSGGIGRAQGGYDEMVFRAMVRDDARFYSPIGVVSAGTAADFQTMTNAYLYGTRFISWLAYTRSPQQVITWLTRGPDSDRYYATQFERVFGLSIPEAWDEWIAWERGFQAKNLASVRQFPVSTGTRVSPRTFGSVSRSFIDAAGNQLVGAFLYPGVVSHVGTVSLADGSVRRLVDVKGPMKYLVSSTAFDPATRTFFYTADNVAYRDLMALDLGTGKAKMLVRDARIGDLAFDAAHRVLYGVRHENGYASLVRLAPPYRDWTQVLMLPYGKVITDLDVSPDGQLLSTSMEEVDSRQYLRVFRLADFVDGAADAPAPVAQFDFGQAVPEGFVFTPDGKALVGSSYYTGVSNLYRFEVATGAIDALTNAETGYFRPIPMADGRVLALEYSGTGFVPTVLEVRPLADVGAITFLGNEIAAKHPVVREWNAGSPAAVPLDALVRSREAYVPRRELRYDGGYPIVQGYRDGVALGWRIGFADPLHLYNLGISASWSLDGDLPSDERLHVRIDYRTLNWHARAWHNHADFYDLFGPIKRSRKGNAVALGYRKLLVYDEPRRIEWHADAAYYTGLDTLPANQNVGSTLDTLASAEVGIDYSNTRKSQASVDHEKGVDARALLSFDHAGAELYPKAQAGFDIGWALPLGNASIWLYNAAGVAGGDATSPLGYFYFGGFHNNRADKGAVKRYREFDTFPGVDIDAIQARRFAKTVLEFNAPPWRFESVGTSGFYLGYIRPAVFVGTLWVDDGSARRRLHDVGVQLDLNFTVMDHLPMTISVGYAQGFEDGQKLDDEWLVSLKVL
jgi:hypothetical protein